jgi:phenylacetate-CoA ligase
MVVDLEKGLFRLCSQLIARDENFKALSKHKQFDQINIELFREYRLYRLQQTLQYAYNNSRFYRTLFDKHGVRPEKVKSISDLAKLPFTNPEDLSKNSYDFLCISQGQVEKPVTYFSTGTTGLKKRIFFSRKDLENIRRFLGVGMNTVTGREGVIQVILPNTAGRGIGTLLVQSLRDMGMQAYATNMMWDSETQIKYTLENRPDVWFGDTGTIYRITKEMEHKVDLSQLGVKVLFLTIVYASPVLVHNLEKIWNCRVCTHYGLTEMGWGLAVECESGVGYHYNELDVIAEVVDPVTGEVLPDGAEGELVYTNLGREAMPLIRYRSHDIATLSSKPCPKGHHLQTLGHVTRRKESIVWVKENVGVYPALFDDIVYSFPEVVDYNIYINNAFARPHLIFEIEVIRQGQGLAARLERAIAEVPAVREHMGRPRVLLLPSGALKKHCYEKKLIRSTIF